MDQYKKYFLLPFILFSFFSVLYSATNLNDQLFSAWLGPIMVFLPFIIFMVVHMSGTIARTSESLWSLIFFSIIGLLISLVLSEEQSPPFVLTSIGTLGNLLYIFWYSVKDRQYNKSFKIGNYLPNFTLKTLKGHIITSKYITSSPALILIYRGNWCPICIK